MNQIWPLITVVELKEYESLRLRININQSQPLVTIKIKGQYSKSLDLLLQIMDPFSLSLSLSLSIYIYIYIYIYIDYFNMIYLTRATPGIYTSISLKDIIFVILLVSFANVFFKKSYHLKR